MRARVRRLLDKKLPNSLERGSDPRAQQQAGGGDVNAAREYVVRTRSQSHSLAPSSRRLVDELMNDPKRKPTSHASFGLSPHALKSMLDVPTRLTELGACVLPERAASLKASADAACDRLVAARTVRALVELMQRFIISIDTGCKSLVTLVCGILVPLSGWRQRFFGKYDDDDALPEESVLQFFDSGIVYHYIVHRVEARSLHPPAPAPAASTTPTSTATARATSLADYDEFATPFLANFSDNVSDFCVGSMCALNVCCACSMLPTWIMSARRTRATRRCFDDGARCAPRCAWRSTWQSSDSMRDSARRPTADDCLVAARRVFDARSSALAGRRLATRVVMRRRQRSASCSHSRRRATRCSSATSTSRRSAVTCAAASCSALVAIRFDSGVASTTAAATRVRRRAIRSIDTKQSRCDVCALVCIVCLRVTCVCVKHAVEGCDGSAQHVAHHVAPSHHRRATAISAICWRQQ